MKRVTVYQIAIVTLLVLAIIIPLAILIPERLDLERPIEINSDEDFLNYEFITGEGTVTNPYLIEDRTIINDGYGQITDVAIYVSNTTKYFVIRNCFIKDYSYGIVIGLNKENTVKIINNYLEDIDHTGIHCTMANGTIIENNEITGGTFNGIYVLYCYNVSVNKNLCYEIGAGILLGLSHNTKVLENNCSFNSDLGIGQILSNYTEIHHNFLGMNRQESYSSAGIDIRASYFTSIYNNSIVSNGYYGITSLRSSFSFIESNNISYNSIIPGSIYGDGIFLEESHFNIIRLNLFEENGYGLNLLKSNNNSIYHNAFILNGQRVLNQAIEENCTGNLWYEDFLLSGNYWQGWNTSLTYPIEGGFSEDQYPLDVNPVNFMLEIHQIRKSFKYDETLNLP